MSKSPNPAIPLHPPREWFTPPSDMAKDTGCIVEADGRIYGYLCHWGSVLMGGSNDRWTPPRSKAGYAYAHTGDTQCDDGSLVKTANLGGDVGHAKVDVFDPDRLQNLQSFYEDTTTQLARVVYGEDANGVWFAGVCWPTITDLEIAKLRASARSGHWAALGDWRDTKSGRAGYELVGACLVNVPGLKYARADRAASGVLSMLPMLSSSERLVSELTVAELAIALKGIADMVTIQENASTSSPGNTENMERVASSGTIHLAAGDSESIPVSGVLVVENQPTEDGRFIDTGAISWRELPLPLYAKLENTPGHDDAQLVGRIDAISRSEDDPNTILYSGVIIPQTADGYGQKVLQAIQDEQLRGVSIDGIAGPDDSYIDQDEIWHMTKLVIGGATLTPMPAIANATVTIGTMSIEGETMTTEASTETEAAAEETAVDTGAANADQMTALYDGIVSLGDRVEYMIGLLEQSQMNARLSAIAARESAQS